MEIALLALTIILLVVLYFYYKKSIENISRKKDYENLEKIFEKQKEELGKKEEENHSLKNENDEFKKLKNDKENLHDKLKDKENQLAKQEEKFNKEKKELKDDYEQIIKKLKDSYESQKQDLESKYKENLEKLEKTNNDNLTKLENTYNKKLKDLETTLTNNIKQHTNRLFSENKNQLSEDSTKIFNKTFEPVKKELKEYKDNLFKNQVRLEQNVKSILNNANTIKADADKLAQILKGDKKIRGNFGELQLKSVLESSGLTPGEQYKLQVHFENEGKRNIPDAVVYLDKQKSIIIDSKFSLPDNFNNKEVDKMVCQQIATNLKKRIDELSSKSYDKFDTSTYEYTLLFIPYQNILDLALSADSNLYQYAYNKKIYLTTPHTLFMALKTINITWTYINSNDKAIEILEEVGKLHDKFAGTIEYLNSVKKSFNSLGNHINDLDSNLTGKGNLIKQFSNLENKGIAFKKSINYNSNNKLVELDEDFKKEVGDGPNLISLQSQNI